jgi:hypothetical protein
VRTARISIRVTDSATGAPVTRCRFEARPEAEGTRTTGFSTASASGQYETWLPVGRQRYTVEGPGYDPNEGEVVVSPGAAPVAIEVRLVRAGAQGPEVTLVVVLRSSASDAPVGEAVIEVVDPRDGRAVARVSQSRPDGRYPIPLPAATWEVRAEAPGFEPALRAVVLDPSVPEAEVVLPMATR